MRYYKNRKESGDGLYTSHSKERATHPGNWDDAPPMQRVNKHGKRTLRVWYIHHAESEVVMKVYSEEDVELCLREQCDIIPYRFYRRLLRRYNRHV